MAQARRPRFDGQLWLRDLSHTKGMKRDRWGGTSFGGRGDLGRNIGDGVAYPRNLDGPFRFSALLRDLLLGYCNIFDICRLLAKGEIAEGLCKSDPHFFQGMSVLQQCCVLHRVLYTGDRYRWRIDPDHLDEPTGDRRHDGFQLCSEQIHLAFRVLSLGHRRHIFSAHA